MYIERRLIIDVCIEFDNIWLIEGWIVLEEEERIIGEEWFWIIKCNMWINYSLVYLLY